MAAELLEPDRAAATEPVTSRSALHSVKAAIVGNIMEWYDFTVYAFLAVYLSRNFFPPSNGAAAMLSTFMVFGIGFLARPLGALFIGWIGDTRGRKAALLLVMPLMAASTLFIGFIPSYASIGLLATILLVIGRFAQGLATGGEFGTALAFIVESAPQSKRGLFAALLQSSTIIGSLLGSGTVALLVSTLATDDMQSWGWRVPFLFGGLVLAPIGYVIRRRVPETPIFERAISSADDVIPLATKSRLMLVTFLLSIGITVYVPMIATYMPAFTQAYSGATPAVALWTNTATLLLMVILGPFFGGLSDRFGRKPLLIGGLALAVVLVYPYFRVLTDAPSVMTLAIAQLLAGTMAAFITSISPSFMSEIFPTRIRTTGLSLSTNLAIAIFGGFAPVISIMLIQRTGSPAAPAFYFIATSIVSIAIAASLRESAHAKLK